MRTVADVLGHTDMSTTLHTFVPSKEGDPAGSDGDGRGSRRLGLTGLRGWSRDLLGVFASELVNPDRERR